MDTLTADAIVGSWQLVRWSIEYPDGRPATLPFGDDALGLIVYAHDGWMTATMCRRGRAGLSAPTAARASIESKARAFEEYLTYGGRWHIEGDAVVHDVLVSMNPALIGVPQRRVARLAGATLDLSAGGDGCRDRALTPAPHRMATTATLIGRTQNVPGR